MKGTLGYIVNTPSAHTRMYITLLFPASLLELSVRFRKSSLGCEHRDRVLPHTPKVGTTLKGDEQLPLALARLSDHQYVSPVPHLDFSEAHAHKWSHGS